MSIATEYTFYQRYAETATHFAGPASEVLIVKTDKGTRSAPAAPTLANRTHNRIELVKIDGYEYSMDGVNWQTSPIFEGLEPSTNYFFCQRIAENDSYYTSPSSASLTAKTDILHYEGEWVVEKEPTCTEDGVKSCICTDCGVTLTASIPALGHTDGEWIIDEDSTCTKEGSKHQICAVCGETIATGVIEVKPHEYTSVVTEPTCVDGGYTTHTCECGDSYVDSYVEPHGNHDYAVEDQHPEAGSLVGKLVYTCTVCGDSYEKEYVWAEITLSGSEFVTAWDLEFAISLTAVTSIPEGRVFTLDYNTVMASFVSLDSSLVSYEWVEGELLLTALADISEGAVFAEITFRTSDHLAEGEHFYLAAREDEGVTAEFAPIKIYEMGDVNLDGAINSRDVMMIKQYVVKMVELNAAQMVYANVYADENADGMPLINSRDAVLLQQFVVKMDVALGDRVTVTFVEGEEETVYTVREGEAMTLVPEATDGCVWSLDRESYIVPDFKAIVADMICYSRREG